MKKLILLSLLSILATGCFSENAETNPFIQSENEKRIAEEYRKKLDALADRVRQLQEDSAEETTEEPNSNPDLGTGTDTGADTGTDTDTDTDTDTGTGTGTVEGYG